MWTVGGNCKLKSWIPLEKNLLSSPVAIFCSPLSSPVQQNPKRNMNKIKLPILQSKGSAQHKQLELFNTACCRSPSAIDVLPGDGLRGKHFHRPGWAPAGPTCRSEPYQSRAPRSTDRAWRFLSWPLSRALIWPFKWKDKGIPHCPLGSQGGPGAWVIKVCFTTRGL